jgi:hypothetical protein
MKQIFTSIFSVVLGDVDFCSHLPLVKVGFLHLDPQVICDSLLQLAFVSCIYGIFHTFMC